VAPRQAEESGDSCEQISKAITGLKMILEGDQYSSKAIIRQSP
jgi:hypothetical protein